MAKKILIIDDEADIQTFLETLLKEHGYETMTASDCEKGWDLLKSFRPDLITLDIIMPKETGQRFYRNLIKDPETRGIPVIILSGVTRYKELFGRDHITMPKPHAFVEKPIVPQELISIIEDALSSKKKSKAAK
jgi:CheY-like chemotaxis protein